MRFLTGDECGLLKEFVPEIAHKKQTKESGDGGKPDIVLPAHYDVAKINNCHGIQRVDPQENQTRARGVVSMTFCGQEETSEEENFSYAALRANGSVEIWQAQLPTGSNKKKFATHQRVSLSGDIFEKARQDSSIPNIPLKPLALASFGSATKNRLCASDTHGNIVILKTDAADIYKPASVVQQYSAFQNTNDNITLTYTKGKVTNTQLASAMAVDTSQHRIAIGGRERDIRLLDLENGETIWKAKNLPPDPQTFLQQPIWPSAMTFVNPLDSNLLAVGTAFGQLRLYDVRTSPSESISRRPIRYTPENFIEHRITAVCQVGEHQVVVGDTTGDIHALDLRKNLNAQHGNKQIEGSSSLGRYVGPAGSIRQLVKHERLPIMAAVGCDRMLRTYNTQTQKCIDCVYLKQRLNCVLVCREGRTDNEFGDEDEDDVDAVNAEDMDMDQEDVVKDYVDSSDDDDDDGESDNGESDNDGDNNEIEDGQQKNVQDEDESSLEDDAGDDKSQSESVSEEEAADSRSSEGESEESDSDDSDDDSDSEEDEAPRKRRKR